MSDLAEVVTGVVEEAEAPPLPMRQRGQAAKSTGGDLTIAKGKVGLGKFFQVTDTGLVVKGKPSLEVWSDMFEFLRICDRAIQFALGDALNRTEADFGEEASQLVDATDWSEETVKNYRWVSAKVPPPVRRADLSFSHHQVVAHLETTELQKQWLAKAAEGTDGAQWSVARLKKEVKGIESSSTETDSYTVTVTCENEARQDELVRQLPNLGFESFKVKKPS